MNPDNQPDGSSLKATTPRESAVNKGARDLRAWERLVLDVSTGLVRLDAEALDTAINAGLHELGAYSGADRVYVFLYDHQQDTMSNSHEWCAPDIPPQREYLQGIPSNAWPYWMEQLLEQGIVNWPVVRALPECGAAERAALSEQGVQSVVAVPITEGEQLLGFVGFDAVSAESFWTEDEMYLLRLSANVIGSAILRLRSEQALSQARERLMHATKLEALGRFVGSTAHNFNNLLTVILASCDVTDRPQTRDALLSRLDQIEVVARKAAMLSRGLLNFGRRQPVALENISLNRLVSETEGFLDSILGETISIECDLDPQAGAVAADNLQLQHVLLNLGANARDAMPHGGTLRLRTWRTRTRNDTEAVGLEISDDGIGMDATTLEQAFEPFFTTKAIGEGTGLGLASVYGIIANLDGEIEIDSKPGRGTTVRIVLPASSASDIPAAVAIPQPEAVRELAGTVVLVEDEPAVLQVVSSMLEKMGLHVIALNRATAALELLQTSDRSIDLLVTDRVMPGMSGGQLIARVRQLRPSLPIVVISGYSAQPLAELLLDTGPLRQLGKPFSYAQLHHAVSDLLGATTSGSAG